MKQTLLIILAFICLPSLVAQKYFEPGTVTKISGEVVQGFIDYKVWEVNPTQINFKTSTESTPVVLTLSDLQAFEITGKDKYIKAEVKKDMRPVKVSQMNIMPENQIVTETAFLRELFRNERIGLYLLHDFKDHFYVQEGKSKFDELIYTIQFSKDNSGIIAGNTFQNQLLMYFPEKRSDPKVTTSLEKLKYTEKGITGFFYSVTNTAPKSEEKVKPVFFAGSGMSISKLKVTGESKMSDHSFNTSLSPIIFVGVDFLSKKNNNAFMIRTQAEYNSANYLGTFYRNAFPSTIEEEKYTLKMSTIRVSVAGLYNYIRSEKTRAYAGLEVSGNFSSYKENVLVRRDTINNTIRTEIDPITYDKTWFGVHGIAGVILNKKIDINATVKLFGAFNNMIRTKAEPSFYELKVAYRF